MKWSGDVEYKETEIKNIPSDWPVTSGTNEWSWMDQDPILPLVGCYAPLHLPGTTKYWPSPGNPPDRPNRAWRHLVGGEISRVDKGCYRNTDFRMRVIRNEAKRRVG